ncbi:hypothetical protein [Agrococcus sp. DT81.2]|uniref:hypothetical protein n=1 Tax=Agrococcus sp. DT81.2 TaxID=3393414 RepID=UPI003CE4FD51
MSGLRVLELRIHGIANAPPADMLCTVNERVERADGDEQGSFWRIKLKSPVRRLPWSTRIQAEAYSWGNQARSGGAALAPIGRAVVHVFWLFVLPFGLCNLAYWARRDIKGEAEDRKWWAGGDGAIAIRIFAMLQTLFYVVGFMTVFVHLIGLQCFRSVADGAARACAALPAWLDFLVEWSPAARAALWSVAPVAIVVLIYVVTRRPRRLFNPDRSFDDEAAPRPRGSRPAKRRSGAADVAPPRPPLLASPAFWQRSRVAQTSERAHLAGSIALVVLLLAGDALLDGQPAGTPVLALVASGALLSSPFAAPVTAAAAIVLLGAVAIVVVAGLSEKRLSVRKLRAWSSVLLVAAVALYLLWLGTALLLQPDAAAAIGLDGDLGQRGLLLTPTVIAALGALIAVASLAWGLGWRRPVVRALLALALLAVAAAELGVRPVEDQSPWPRFWLSVIAVAAVALAVVVAYVPSRQPEVRAASRLAAWHGNGAAISLLVSLLSSLVMTTLLVVGTHAWLTAPRGEAEVSGPWRVLDAQRAQSDCRAVAEARITDASSLECVIAAPPFYERFSVMVVAIIVVVAIVVGMAVLAATGRPVPAFSIPSLRFPGSTPAQRRDADGSLGGTAALTTDPRRVTGPSYAHPDAPHVVPPRDYPPPEWHPSGRRRTAAHARRTAALLHRGEPVLRWVAIMTALALVPLAVPFWGELLSRDNPSNAIVRAAGWYGPDAAAAWSTAVDASLWVLGLLALAAVAWVVMNAVTAAERPLGLVWDIICFFPMAGHPFGPPCYGERVVPELRKRVRTWLAEEGEGARVILAAHSMGAVIAAATVFAIHGADQRRGVGAAQANVQRLALLTFGAQLRPYFSRFFPQVFGADVLGIRGTTGPTLLGPDPWREQVLVDFAAPAMPAAPGSGETLVELLGGDPRDRATPPRWRSLWRRTDPLGFPVDSYWGATDEGDDAGYDHAEGIDRGASERSPTSYLWAIAGHSDYLSTLQYRAARDELVAMLGRKAQR